MRMISAPGLMMIRILGAVHEVTEIPTPSVRLLLQESISFKTLVDEVFYLLDCFTLCDT